MAEEHIKINPVPTKVKYSGNGVVREFPTGFAFFEDDNIVVYHNGVIINTGYSVTGVGETDGGVVTFDVAPAEGDKIVIIRKVAIERVTDFQEGGAFRAKNINDELDRQTAFCQQIQEEIDRCVKVEVTDDQTPEELLTEVYGKLDSATAVATDAILAAEQATIAAEQATTAVEEAKKQVVDTQKYVDNAKLDINNTVEAGKQEINTTIDEAQMNLSDTIEQAVDDVKTEAVAAAEGAIQGAADTAIQIATDHANTVIKPELQTYVDSSNANATVADNAATVSRTWATGTDEEVQALEDNEHSSRTYANFAMALANADEDVPVLESTLLATGVIIPDLTDYVKNTDYPTATASGVVKLGSTSFGVTQYNGYLQGYTATLENYNKTNNPYIVCKGTLENIKNNYVKEAITTNDVELTDDEKTSARTWLGAVGNTDYATSSKGGVIVSSGSYGAMVSQSTGYLYAPTKTLAEYNSMATSSFIGKGTLNNVLTQYAKTVSLTQAEYDALETKDANTLYLIEEE